MFESAEIGHAVDKARYKREEPKLRRRLLALQRELLDARGFPMVILVNGLDGAGKGETVNLLNEWMDPRHIHTHAFDRPDAAERRYPPMWRYWRALPPKGHIGVLFASWYREPIDGRVDKRVGRAELDLALERIRHFERMLVAEGAVLVKLWFHLSKRAQKARLKSLEADRDTAWRVTRADWEHYRARERFVRVAEEALRQTSSAAAPWHVVEGADPYYRALTAGRLIEHALAARLAGERPALAPQPPPAAPPIDGRTLLGSFDYGRKLKRREYDERLAAAQARVARATRSKRMRRRSLVLVFEGVDAAGKGSTIRRLTHALDARFYRVVPVAAPTDEEAAQPYLWRFWRQVPARGSATIFDRSWYGRVLVERVERLCPESDWQRAYPEINEFEEQLVESGAIVAKFWLAISAEEQLRRFRARERTPHKRHKITPDDWRNRKQWGAYERAVEDMVARTSSAIAPWHIVASDDKRFARVEVLETLAARLEEAL